MPIGIWILGLIAIAIFSIGLPAACIHFQKDEVPTRHLPR